MGPNATALPALSTFTPLPETNVEHPKWKVGHYVGRQGARLAFSVSPLGKTLNRQTLLSPFDAYRSQQRKEKFDWGFFFPGVAYGSAQQPSVLRPLSPPGPGCILQAAEQRGRRGAGLQTRRCSWSSGSEDTHRTERTARTQLSAVGSLSAHISPDQCSFFLIGNTSYPESSVLSHLARSGITEPSALSQDVGTFREWPPRRDFIRFWRYVGCNIKITLLLPVSLACKCGAVAWGCFTFSVQSENLCLYGGG